MATAARESGFSRSELLQAIMDSLQSWPDMHRRIFIDIHYGGRPASEIASSLGISLEEIDSILESCSANLNDALRGFRGMTADKISGFALPQPVRVAACCR